MKMRLNMTVWLVMVSFMTAPALGQDDSAAGPKEFTISGNAGVPNATIRGVPGNVITDSDGRFIATVPYNWVGTITPGLSGHKFDPPSISFACVSKNHHDQNFNVIAPIPMMTSSNLEVLVVPTTEVKPNQFSAIQQDMRVMLHILKKAAKDEKNQLVGGVFSQYGNLLGRNDQSLQSLYIQGYGALFFVQAGFPLEWSSEPVLAVGSEDKEKPSADPVWQQASNQVFNPASQANQPRSSRRDTEALMRKLIEGLKHAANIRYLAPDERVVVTLLSGSEAHAIFGMSTGRGGGMSGYMGGMYGREPVEEDGMYGGGGYGGGRGGGGPYGYDMESYGGRAEGRSSGFGASSGQSTVRTGPKSAMTLQVKKVQIDAFSEGKMGLDEFTQCVHIMRY